ncbi:hypothetical protein DEU56DRAFT_913360 [Suillus clintonianus]|uniref:uncharacterized protein n=1 Tax=Suillus clintonianus TaxID=1904413 RepID=UPI001B877638|nr:uncharacterized protein DEU56DRAFT_913360 [Suillus clintonianus]KAG2135243.1 hypothetical protein DEU56DRAFT_913360 [Suillus clintonianus]
MFSLPVFEKLDDQLTRHQEWLEDLPWYCPQHECAHGREILNDVEESTRQEDDQPPIDEYFTCICTTPVRPPPPGTHSDAVQPPSRIPSYIQHTLSYIQRTLLYIQRTLSHPPSYPLASSFVPSHISTAPSRTLSHPLSHPLAPTMHPSGMY